MDPLESSDASTSQDVCVCVVPDAHRDRGRQGRKYIQLHTLRQNKCGTDCVQTGDCTHAHVCVHVPVQMLGPRLNCAMQTVSKLGTLPSPSPPLCVRVHARSEVEPNFEEGTVQFARRVACSGQSFEIDLSLRA